MRLISFSDVHPDWTVVQSLAPAEVRATLELLITAMLLDGRISVSERETLIDEFARLPVHESDIGGSDVKRMVYESEDRMRSMDADDFGDYLDAVCERIESRDKRIAVLRLVTILAVSDGFSEDEFDLCRAIGHRFDLEMNMVEDILRTTWETRQAAVAQLSGDTSRTPHVTGARYYEDRSDSYGHPKPFSQEEITGEYSR